MDLDGIGLAGCGRMGAGMLASMRRGGFDARGFDIRPAEEFGALAPFVSNDARAFGQGLHTLFIVVRDIAQTEEVLFGTQNFTALPDLRRIVICSTLSPRYVLELRNRIDDRIALIDAPMSGAQVAADEARLSFMLGGEDADLDAIQPLLETMGRHFHRMGGFGAGMQAKVLNNLLAASSTAMTRLVLGWADAAGLDETALLRLIDTSSGQNWFATAFDRIEFARDGYDPENTIGILVKDVESALDAAPEGADLALPRTVQAAIRALKPRANQGA